MLVIKPRTGAGFFDVFSKIANSALTKKVLNSAISKKVIEKATKDNLVKAANSAIGKEIQSAVVKGVADASEKAANSAFKKLGISAPPAGLVAKSSEQALNKLGISGETPEKKVLEKVFAATTLPRKRKIYRPGRSKKRRKTGAGIILE